MMAFSSWATPPTDYLSAWDLDEGQGTALHDSGPNLFHGAIQGASWTQGVRGGALRFDGVDDFVAIEDGAGYPDAIGNLTMGSISVWFKLNRLPQANTIQPIFCLGDSIGGVGYSGIVIEVGHFWENEYKLYFTVIDDDAEPSLCFDSATDLQTGQWYHFVAVVGNDFNTGYLNGLEMTNRHYNGGDPSSTSFFVSVADKQVCWLGKGYLAFLPNENYLDGVLDEVRVYGRPLSATEVQNYYLETLHADEENLSLVPGTGLGVLIALLPLLGWAVYRRQSIVHG